MSSCVSSVLPFEHSAEVVSLGCSTVAYPAFLCNFWVFARDTLRLCKCPVSAQSLPLLLSPGRSCLWHLLLWRSNGDFSICFISSIFNNWNSSGRKNCGFWIYIFNYIKIFRIGTNSELKDINRVNWFQMASIKEKKQCWWLVFGNIMNLRWK